MATEGDTAGRTKRFLQESIPSRLVCKKMNGTSKQEQRKFSRVDATKESQGINLRPVHAACTTSVVEARAGCLTDRRKLLRERGGLSESAGLVSLHVKAPSRGLSNPMDM